MNKDKLLIARQKYDKEIDQMIPILNANEELKLLEQNEKVKRYLFLKQLCENTKIKEIDDIITAAFSSLLDKTNLPNIFIYLGAYKYDYSYESRSDFLINDINSADYLLYNNIENYYERYSIKPNLKQDFERDKIIIKLDQKFQYYYNKIRAQYLKYLLDQFPIDEFIDNLNNNKEKFGIIEIIKNTSKTKTYTKEK